MLQLLVDRREELAVGDIIPVGDLWDVIAQGDEPFTDAMRIQFENAKKLWSQRLLPLLERQHGVPWQDLEAGRADPKAAEALRNDARLLKTLLLSALVPEEESLRALTPFTRGPLAHLLRNRFYVGEVAFKGELLRGEQPAIVDRDLFDAVRQAAPAAGARVEACERPASENLHK